MLHSWYQDLWPKWTSISSSLQRKKRLGTMTNRILAGPTIRLNHHLLAWKAWLSAATIQYICHTPDRVCSLLSRIGQCTSNQKVKAAQRHVPPAWTLRRSISVRQTNRMQSISQRRRFRTELKVRWSPKPTMHGTFLLWMTWSKIGSRIRIVSSASMTKESRCATFMTVRSMRRY